MNHCVFPISDDYQRHPIHTQERNWAETNCYVDVWIELLHAWGFDPVAALPFTVGIDFEGDQWTFFKFPLTDLRELYGLDVQELLIWRPLAEHIVEQVRLGRPVLVELDSFFLPDTEGTAYRRAHVKSTVAVIEIDPERRRMGYFHGQGFYRVDGDDFTNVLRIGEGWPAELLPPYVEFVKPREAPRPTRKSLVTSSLRRLRREVDRLPEENPFEKFRRAFARDLDWLTHSPLEVFHQYAFATWRQFGACYELAATYLQWLKERRVSGFEGAHQAFAELSGSAKTLQFQLARAMARKKPFDLSLLDVLVDVWNRAVDELRSGLAWNESSVDHDPEFVEMR
jgi:hypothetical protein